MTIVKNLTNFPFAAIIGQDEMKLALQLNVIITFSKIMSSIIQKIKRPYRVRWKVWHRTDN